MKKKKKTGEIVTFDADLSKVNMSHHVEIKDIKTHDGDVEHDFIIEGFASTEDLDRGNDVTHSEAFMKTLKAFMNKNPIVLYMHDMKQPIGTIISASIEQGKGLFVKAFISKTEPQIREKIQEKILRAFSFGYYVEKSDEEDMGRNKRPVRHIRILELLEVSVVSIGMNREALFSMAKSLETGSDLVYKDGYVEDLEKAVDALGVEVAEIKEMVKDFLDIKTTVVDDSTNVSIPKDALDTLKNEDGTEMEVPKATDLEPDSIEDETKTVIAPRDYGGAPVDTPWDGAKERREADIPTLRKISTWFDSSKPDAKSSYKLPHHRASDLVGIWNGVRAAMGSLLGSRDGVNIPSGDRKGVYNHLASHYPIWDKTPPEFKEYDEQELKTLEEQGLIEALKNNTDNESVDDKEEKAGRVVSGKNRKLMTEAVGMLEKTMSALTKILEADKGGHREREDDEDHKPKKEAEEPMSLKQSQAIMFELEGIKHRLNN